MHETLCKHCRLRLEERGDTWVHAEGDQRGKHTCALDPYGFHAEPVGTLCSGNPANPCNGFKDEHDALIHFEKLQQLYLVYYRNELGGLFSSQTDWVMRRATENAEEFIADGYPARLIEVTVKDGEPVAMWVAVCKHCGLRIQSKKSNDWVHAEGDQRHRHTCALDPYGFHAEPVGTLCSDQPGQPLQQSPLMGLAASGSWKVRADETFVRVEFTHVNDEGVEKFETNMPPECALALGYALIDEAEGVDG